jgi:vacuolar-type H+-ATPase subunit I/STV1
MQDQDGSNANSTVGTDTQFQAQTSNLETDPVAQVLAQQPGSPMEQTAVSSEGSEVQGEVNQDPIEMILQEVKSLKEEVSNQRKRISDKDRYITDLQSKMRPIEDQKKNMGGPPSEYSEQEIEEMQAQGMSDLRIFQKIQKREKDIERYGQELQNLQNQEAQIYQGHFEQATRSGIESGLYQQEHIQQAREFLQTLKNPYDLIEPLAFTFANRELLARQKQFNKAANTAKGTASQQVAGMFPPPSGLKQNLQIGPTGNGNGAPTAKSIGIGYERPKY